MLLFRRHPFEREGKLGIVTGEVQYEGEYRVSECLRWMLRPKLEERWSLD